jgi:hypothetical protein
VVAFLFRALIVLYVAWQSDALDRLHSFHEAVGIARALAAQHAFATFFHDESATMAWIAPVYPVLPAGLLTILEVETKAFLVPAAILNSLFAALTAGVSYKIGPAVWRQGRPVGGVGPFVRTLCCWWACCGKRRSPR